MPEHDGKTALITGGGTGIGRATAEQLAGAGCRVLVCGRREAPLQRLAASAPDHISYVTMDVAQRADRERALAVVRERFGRLDILINNAAMAVVASFADHAPEQIQQQVEVNLVAPALLTHAALELMGDGSCIVNVTSAGARYQGMPAADIAPYSSAKAGLNQLTRVLATELGSRGIRVNAVAPGFTDTEMSADALADPQYAAGVVALTPLGRVGEPQDVARVICFLASDQAAWITGQVVDATGGLWLAS